MIVEKNVSQERALKVAVDRLLAVEARADGSYLCARCYHSDTQNVNEAERAVVRTAKALARRL